MTQFAKIIDVTKGFIVIDPNAFFQNLSYTSQEDSPEKAPPILGYEGYNFLPTSYGYRSYFGVNSPLDVSPLPSRCDKILLYQFANYRNILVALCEDGIFITTPGTSGSTWNGAVGWAFQDWLGGRGMIMPGEVASSTYKRWTYAILANTLYMYREGESVVYSIGPTDIDLFTGAVTVNSLTPSFLNMAGQKGIFRANGRIGFWDSTNLVSWSSAFDLMDLTPSLETLAGHAVFNALLGNIVNILSQGDGFVIYTTKGIVGVRYTQNSNGLWEANTITDTAGIAYPYEVCTGLTDLEHFAYTNTGLKLIGAFNALNKAHNFTEIVTDVYDLLKQDGEPVYLQMINGRYLFLSLINNDYIDGKVSFSVSDIADLTARILFNGAQWNGIDILPVTIGGVPAVDHMASVLAQGIDMGMYLQWNATGETMVPSRTTAINPYNISSTSIHIANTGLDLSSKVDQATVDALVTGGSYTDESSASYPFAVDLGWTYPGLNAVADEEKGLTDSYLSEFISTQHEEWNNFITIQAATKAKFEGAMPVTSGVVNGSTKYYSSADANAAMEALILAEVSAHAGASRSGNSVSWDVTVGDLLSGSGSVTGPVFSGVGTNYGSVTMSKDFSGGWDVKRRTTRVFSTRMSDDINGYKTSASWRWDNYNPPMAFETPNDIKGFGLTAGDSQANYLAALTATIPQTMTGDTTPYNCDGTPRTSVTFLTPVLYNGVPGQYPVTAFDFSLGFKVYLYSSTIPPCYPLGTSYAWWLTGSQTTVVATYNEYYIDYQDTKYLTTAANPSLSGSAEMNATQENLTWGIVVPGQPGGDGGFPYTFGAITIPGISLRNSFATIDLNVTYPGNTFLISDGIPAPVYPTFAGALVLDTALKKWGKMKAYHRALLDIAPINSINAPLSFTNFGMEMGLLDSNGVVYVLDARPADSWIRYGKIGYHRAGMTQMQEVEVHFNLPSTGSITIDTSLDGRVLDSYYTVSSNFNSSVQATAYGSNIGKYHTVTIAGHYDIQYLEFRGNSAGRR